MLKSIVSIVKILKEYEYSNAGLIKGKLCNLTSKNIDLLNDIETHIDLRSSSDEFFKKDDLKIHLNNDIFIEISAENIANYYNSFSSFLNKNKIKKPEKEFYIKDIDYFCDEKGKCSNQKLVNYFKNIELIEFLKSIADYESKTGSFLELFFYKSEQGGLKLNINYNDKDLESLNIGNLNELKNHLLNKPDKEERKQIFVNEAIEFLKKNNSYAYFLQNWDSIYENYQRSFDFYLAGFSFEKIKMASIEYFQKLMDRSYNQVNKATTNIFIVPAAYILLLQSFSLSNGFFLNTLLLIAALLFSFLMHRVIFNNMSDGLDAIRRDVDKFKERDGQKVYKYLLNDLEEFDSVIKKQDSKVKILKLANWILFLFLTLAFLYKYCFFS